jgi:Tfp pilus assembly protein PilE
MNQHGVTFLEAIIVIAILMIVTSLVSPSIADWRQKRALELDYYAVLSRLDCLKTRYGTINGTSTLICASNSGVGKTLTYRVSSKPQADASSLSADFATNLVEDTILKDPNFNIISRQSQIVSSICNGLKGIFLSLGQSVVEGGSLLIDIAIEPIARKSKFSAYRVLLNQSTGFIQRFKWNVLSSQWVEIE